MMAKEDILVLNVAQLSCIAALPDWEMTFSALTSGFDFENQPPILRYAVELFDGWRKCWLLKLLEVTEDLYDFPA